VKTHGEKECAPWYANRLARDLVTGCAIWQGALDHGYAIGRIPGGPTTKIARAVYQDAHGPIPAGVTIGQTCGNRACCAAEHLAPRTLVQAVMSGEGVCAVNARKSSCKRDHPFDSENTYIDTAGRRRCRTCKLMMEQAWHAAGNRKRRPIGFRAVAA
jgi:hypothetical protein